MAGGKCGKRGVLTDESGGGTCSSMSDCAICSVYDDPIREKSSTCGGDDALQCEGRCQSWFHRCSAGVSSKHFSDLSVSSEPFCATCVFS